MAALAVREGVASDPQVGRCQGKRGTLPIMRETVHSQMDSVESGPEITLASPPRRLRSSRSTPPRSPSWRRRAGARRTRSRSGSTG